MIVRLCRVQVRPGKERDFEEFTKREAVPFMKHQKGLRDFSFGWGQRPGVMNVMSWWDSFEDVKRFAGPNVDAAVILPNEAVMVERMTIEHYSTLSPASGGPRDGPRPR
jgi:hypothetical protein